MSLSLQDLKKIADLAYLNSEDTDPEQLAEEVNAIMDFVAQLSAVNTKQVTPLSHPFALHQALRADVITEEDCIRELEMMAPLFEDNLYLVPGKALEADE